MSICSRTIWALLFLSLLGLSRGQAADNALSTEEVATAAAETDPAFDRLVDLSLLSQAMTDLDASLAADVALQLADGERVLGRPHAALSADRAFELCLRLVTQNRDTVTLDRLAAVAKANGHESWVAQLDAAKTLLATSRAAEPALDTSNWSDVATEFANVIVHGLRLAQLVQDETAHGELVSAIKESSLLGDAERQALLKVAQAYQPAEDQPAAADDAVALQQLLLPSRGEYLPPPGSLALELSGGEVTLTLSQADLLVTNQMGAQILCPDAITYKAGDVAIQPNKSIQVRSSSSSVKLTGYTTKRITFGGKPFMLIKIPLSSTTVKMPAGLSLTGRAPVKASLKK